MFLLISIAYNFAMPIFEGMDEGPHYIAVDYIATNHAFADLNTYPFGLSQEVSQPPLYYLVGAPLIAWIDRSDFSDFYHLNPGHSVLAYDHTTAEFAFPPRGTILAVHLLRLYSSLLGAITLVLVYVTAKMVFNGEGTAMFAVGLTAFNPEFIHRSSTITNDIAVLCTGAATITMTVWLLRHKRTPSRRAIVLWGCCFGLAFLSKFNAISLALLIGCAIVWLAVRHRTVELRSPSQIKSASMTMLKTVIVWIILFSVGFLLTAGWYLVYNTLRYGDPLLMNQLYRAHAHNLYTQPQRLVDILVSIPHLIDTYWVSIGYGMVPPAAIRVIFAVTTLLAAVGLVFKTIRGRLPRLLIWIGIASIAAFLAWLPWLISIGGGDHARFLDPAHLAIQIMLAAGLTAWIPARLEKQVHLIIVGMSYVIAVSIIPSTILPMYGLKPFRLSDEYVRQLPAEGRVRFDNHLEIVYVSLASNRINSGDSAHLTFYWRAYDFMEKMNLLVIEAIDEKGARVARQTVEPMGSYDTSRWGMGSVMSETIDLPLSALRQTIADIYVGWVGYDAPYDVAHVVGQKSVSAKVATVKVRGQRQPEITPGQRISASYGDIVNLEGFDLLTDSIRLYWRSQGQPTRQFTNFVHFYGEDGQMLAQSDAPFHYPSTLWDIGEQIIETHPLPNVDMGKVNRIDVGIYDSETQQRLTLTDSTSVKQSDNAVELWHK